MADDGKQKKGCCEKFGDGLSNFGTFLYNSEAGLVMGRTGKSWLKIGFFYLIFYGFLAAFFSAMLTVFLKTLNDVETGKGPKLVQFLENKPGLTYKKGAWTLKKFAEAAPSDEEKSDYTTMVENIFKKYNSSSLCGDSSTGMPDKTECRFDVSKLGACGPAGASSNYGVNDGKPCAYVRINKVFGWVPEPTQEGGPFLDLDCGDEDGVDVFPKGFHIGSFPFRGQKDFELPLVAVQIDPSKLTKVVCKLVGPNIEVSESVQPHRAFAKVEIS